MLNFSQVSHLNFPIETLVLFVFYIILGIYAVFTAILYYHWKTYGVDDKVSGLTIILYFTTTIPLILIMTITALII